MGWKFVIAAKNKISENRITARKKGEILEKKEKRRKKQRGVEAAKVTERPVAP